MLRVAMLSVHGCPFARLGEKDTGGMNVYVLQMARELGRLGIQVDVYTRYHDPNDLQVDKLEKNVRLIHIEAGPYANSKKSLHRHIPEFLSNLQKFLQSDGSKYDLLYSHYWISSYAGLTLSKTWGVPHVATFHTTAKAKMESRAGEMESHVRVKLETEAVDRLDLIIVSTSNEKDELSRFYKANTDKIKVIPAGVDLNLFRPMDQGEARAKLGIFESKVILSVGRIEPLKGLDLLVSAVQKIHDLSDTRIFIVGGELGYDPEMGRLKKLALDLDVSEFITFTGSKPQTELPYYYSASDVLVMPSHYESFGLVALESMACGTPVISSRVGGPSSFIDNQINGFLMPWRRPEAYAETIELLFSDPLLHHRIATQARKKALAMGWDTMAKTMEECFWGLVDSSLGKVSSS